METITANLYEYRSKTVVNAVDLKESAEMHREIYRAIRSHNPAQARVTMEQHLNLARIAQASEAEAAAAAAQAPPAPEPENSPAEPTTSSS
jgi:GntR family transcriptional repressor for pyruvate dehydrogenase complex